jgi:hypothetical protein
MTDEHATEVLSALPHRRPHRRSDKRAARPAVAAETAAPKTATRARASATPVGKAARPVGKSASQTRLRQPAQPAGAPPSPRSRGSVPATGAEVLGTAVHAAAELAEIGLTAGARALRNAVARLPRP